MNSVPIHPIGRNIALRFEKVAFSYDGAKVLEDASFHIHQGEFVALVGPNGTGKTTALKLLLGLEQPQGGSIEIFGEKVSHKSLERVGYVPQQHQLDRAFPITVSEVVKMGRIRSLSRKFSAEDKAAVAEALEQVEIQDLASRPYSALSGGQRRRVLVARALAAQPNILILDEPTANMDEESSGRLFKTLGKLKGNTTILIVTHDSDFVSSLIDRVLCMEERGYGIVQHRVEDSEDEEASSHGIPSSRVIHGEIIPGDSCFDEARS
ncbi:metal ABC transporter ATP-binding protein [Leadbettera azotonutricia]|uniref:Chelated iron transport system membrane protein YfeB n=1 Tax=Leadbettera azotonutricia (strain ATCC BAA-888 / DSM 13862 / ZAS-9) TaxID=545695 RepID=F5YG34_LEAAZ|nr:metal ABC transporter ATP-binding protein [Leadbettera azotonutricia]AEF82855.1 chelated iron transport system membrane protein YfeB [Leadbettera azotonutricia ZAS-9]